MITRGAGGKFARNKNHCRGPGISHKKTRLKGRVELKNLRRSLVLYIPPDTFVAEEQQHGEDQQINQRHDTDRLALFQFRIC